MNDAFAAIVPIDSTPIGIWRGVELLNSLAYWEPCIDSCVVLEDADVPLGTLERSQLPSTCRALTVSNPLKHLGSAWTGGLTAGILRGLRYLLHETPADFVLRIDADGLVINTFADAVRRFLGADEHAGVIGVIGGSCNPRHRECWYRTRPKVAQLVRALHAWPSPTTKSGDRLEKGGGVQFPGGFISYGQLCAFDSVRPHIFAAMSHGYIRNEDCQGGACVITRELMTRMDAAGYLDDVRAWSILPFTDDQVLAMYAYATGLRIVDCSSSGHPFGVQCSGLAYSPEELVNKGYALIHSVKNDPNYSEDHIRHYFTVRQACRSSLATRP